MLCQRQRKVINPVKSPTLEPHASNTRGGASRERTSYKLNKQTTVVATRFRPNALQGIGKQDVAMRASHQSLWPYILNSSTKVSARYPLRHRSLNFRPRLPHDVPTNT